MKVLHACNYHRGGGGLDAACDTTIRISRERGLDVELFARDSGDLPGNLGGKVQAFVSGICGGDGVRSFVDQLHASKPDVVHAHELYPLISPWILPRCRAAGVPVVATVYDYRLTCPIATHYRDGEICHRCLGGREHWAAIKNCRGNRAESIAYALRSGVARRFGLYTEYVDRFMVISEFSRSWLIEHAGIERERTMLNPCALPIPARSVEDPSRGEYVGYAGRIVAEKGVGVLAQAAQQAGLPLKFCKHVDSLGDPALEALAPCVMTRTPDELAEFYRGARIMVVPSLWYDTSPLVAAEAMSHGVPTVVARIGGLAESVVDGESGLLVEPGRADDLAAKLTRLWHDPDLCRRLGAAGRERVCRRCSEAAHFEGLRRLYESVCEARPLTGRTSAQATRP